MVIVVPGRYRTPPKSNYLGFAQAGTLGHSSLIVWRESAYILTEGSKNIFFPNTPLPNIIMQQISGQKPISA